MPIKKVTMFAILIFIAAGLLTACAAKTTIKSMNISGISDAARVQEEFTIQLTSNEGTVFEYSLLFPGDWMGKYAVRAEDNIVYIDYSVNPDLQHPLFLIAALDEGQWEAAQKEPVHGEELIRKDGMVFVFNTALDNPYSGYQAEEFQRMASQVREIVAQFEVKSE